MASNQATWANSNLWCTDVANDAGTWFYDDEFVRRNVSRDCTTHNDPTTGDIALDKCGFSDDEFTFDVDTAFHEAVDIEVAVAAD